MLFLMPSTTGLSQFSSHSVFFVITRQLQKTDPHTILFATIETILKSS